MRAIDDDISAEFERRLRRELADKERAWLIDELVGLALRSHNLADTETAAESRRRTKARAERSSRASELSLDENAAREFAERHHGMTREQLIATGLVRDGVDAKGGLMLDDADLTPRGRQLRENAKDMLFALLFGDPATDTRLERVQSELLTVALPRSKAAALDFMRAATELSAAGTWRDPSNVANDERADNVLIEVQFGETSTEIVGKAVLVTLELLNELQINEELLYVRMINIEESTL